MAYNPISSNTNYSGPLSSNSIPLIEKLDVCINYLASSDPRLVVKALNFLVARTADGFDGLSNVVQLTTEFCPRIIIALGELLDVVNPMGKIPYRDLNERDLESLLTNFSTPVLTFDLPSAAMNPEFKFLGQYLDDNPVLMCILMILRNMSFEAILEGQIAYNTTIMNHFTSILLWSSCHLVGPMPDSTHLVYDTLTRIVGRVDFYGKRRAMHIQNAMEIAPLEGSSMRLMKAKLNPAYTQVTLPLYVYTVRLLVPILFNAIVYKGRVKQPDVFSITTGSNISAHYVPSRFLVVSALDLLKGLIGTTENATYLTNCPMKFTQTLASYLNVSLLRSEVGCVSETQGIMGDVYGRMRPPPAVTLPRPKRPDRFAMSAIHSVNYGAQNTLSMDYVDQELRELVLDVLHVLSRLSNQNAQPLVSSIPVLLKLVQVGPMEGNVNFALSNSRPEYMVKAHGILAAVATLPASEGPLRMYKTELLAATTRDDLIADLVLNRFHPAFNTLADNVPNAPSDTVVTQVGADASATVSTSDMML
eukprot:gene31551-38134_t